MKMSGRPSPSKSRNATPAWIASARASARWRKAIPAWAVTSTKVGATTGAGRARTSTTPLAAAPATPAAPSRTVRRETAAAPSLRLAGRQAARSFQSARRSAPTRRWKPPTKKAAISGRSVIVLKAKCSQTRSKALPRMPGVPLRPVSRYWTILKTCSTAW